MNRDVDLTSLGFQRAESRSAKEEEEDGRNGKIKGRKQGRLEV